MNWKQPISRKHHILNIVFVEALGLVLRKTTTHFSPPALLNIPHLETDKNKAALEVQ